MKAVVIYHDNCMDGFASAWAFHVLKEKDYPEGVEYWPYSYDEHLGLQEIAKITDEDVFILDFSFSRNELSDIAECAKSVLILDHHKTAQEALSNWTDAPKNLKIVFDMEQSGAGLTWEYFGGVGSSPLVSYVEDRDLWRFFLTKSKAINARIALAAKTFKSYSDLNNDIFTKPEEVIAIGEALSQQHQQICESIILNARTCILTTNDGTQHEGLVCNCTHQFASEVGSLLAKLSGTYGATYYSNKEGAVHWSLRSIGDYDVSAIARECGGGGHKNAAGFILHPNGLDRTDIVKMWTIPQDDKDWEAHDNG